jgi:succinyl-CoA synthetase alpha subunit
MAALSRKLPFAYTSGGATADAMLENISLRLDIRSRVQQALFNLISALHGIFMTKEAFVLETKTAITKEGEVQVQEAWFGFDDASLKTAGRQRDTHAFRDKASETFEKSKQKKVV